jgi:hypothetical protein
MSATNRLGAILSLLGTALKLGLATFICLATMNWLNQGTGLELSSASNKADPLVNGYCHRVGASTCTPELVDASAVPGHSHDSRNMGWKLTYRLSPQEQMQVTIDERGTVQSANTLPPVSTKN